MIETPELALGSHFPGTFPAAISGGFFAPYLRRTFQAIKKHPSSDPQSTLVWVWLLRGMAVAPKLRRKSKRRVTFPAYEPEKIAWAILKLKEIAARLAWGVYLWQRMLLFKSKKSQTGQV